MTNAYHRNPDKCSTFVEESPLLIPPSMEKKTLLVARDLDGELSVEKPLIPDRLTILPIQHTRLWKMYEKARDSFWLPREVNLSVDADQWETKLCAEERHALTRILSFFATADGIVADNLVERFIVEVPLMEAKFFYGFQIMMENIHAETYSLMLHHLIPSDEERNMALTAAFDVPSVSAKNRWARKWLLDLSRPLSHRLVAFACVEGIFFSSSFAVIYWFKSRNLLPGLCHSNDLISRDEGLHTDFACELLQYLGELPPAGVVQEIVTGAVDTEIEFVKDFLPGPLLGLTPSSMCTYVQFVADQLLNNLGYSAVFNVENSFPLMGMAAMPGRTNFFERRNADYRMPFSSHRDMSKEEFSLESFARHAERQDA